MELDRIVVAESDKEVSDKSAFLAAVEAAVNERTFIKLTLGKYRGEGEQRKAVACLVEVKSALQLRFVESRGVKDFTSIRTLGDALHDLGGQLGEIYLSATLFLTTRDWTLSYSKKRKSQLTSGKPTLSAPPPTDHNRQKLTVVDPARPYLQHLDLTFPDGRVKPSMHPKFKQINHFIEIIDDVLGATPKLFGAFVAGVDIGAGKGYLTFALYDYLVSRLKLSCRLTGIEQRPELVSFCNDLAAKSGFAGLHFEATAAASVKPAAIDLLIALHACDTATDDAIAYGVLGGAKLIVVAPCCQHEIAPQLTAANDAVAGITRYGLLKQRQADLVTDAARALLLEASGYKTRIVEFVSTEHTAKNLLIVATRGGQVDRAGALKQYRQLKSLMRFETHHLETLLPDIGRLVQP